MQNSFLLEPGDHKNTVLMMAPVSKKPTEQDRQYTRAELLTWLVDKVRNQRAQFPADLNVDEVLQQIDSFPLRTNIYARQMVIATMMEKESTHTASLVGETKEVRFQRKG